MADEEPQDSAMIALLPMTSDWCKLELPHMTLVYAGLCNDLPPSAMNEMAKDAASLAMLSNPISLRVMEVDIFGDEEKVDVLRLRPTPELLSMRKFVERWNASEHPFKPHATIGPTGNFFGPVPDYLYFDRIVVQYGDKQIPFWFKR